MPETIVEGCRLFYTVDGPADAPALLLSNALGTTSELWARQVPAFARRFRVIRYHTRGHGRSAVVPGDPSLRQLGQDALGVLDAAGAARAHVCGSSLGGQTALWLGIHAPARVDRLVPTNTSARIGTPEHWQERIAQVRSHGLTNVSATGPTRWFTEAFRRPRGALMTACRAMLDGCPPEGYLGGCAALRDADLREDVSRIAAPVLIVSGLFDPVIPPEDGRVLQRRIAGSQLLELPAAHFANVEAAPAYTAAVLRFLTA